MDGDVDGGIYAKLVPPAALNKLCAGHATTTIPDAHKLVVTTLPDVVNQPMSSSSSSIETQQQVGTSATSSISASDSATSQTQIQLPTSTSSADSNSQNTSSHTSAAVIGVLAGLLFLIVALTPVLYLWHRRRQRLRHAQREVIGRMKLIDPLATSSHPASSRPSSFRSSFSQRWSMNMTRPSLFGKKRSGPSFIGAGGIEMSQTKVMHSSGPEDRGCGLPMTTLPGREQYGQPVERIGSNHLDPRPSVSGDTDSIFSTKQGSDVGDGYPVRATDGLYVLTLDRTSESSEAPRNRG